MPITLRKQQREVEMFKDLDIGDSFQTQYHGNTVYIVTFPSKTLGRDGIKFNSVSVVEGSVEWFEDDVQVKPVDAVLTLALE